MTSEIWLAEVRRLGLVHKFDWQLEYLKGVIPYKIGRLQSAIYIPDPLLTQVENQRQAQEFETYKQLKIARLKHKLECVIKELEFRKEEIVKRDPIGTTYYLDVNGKTGDLSGTWTFTNGSTTVSGSGGSATSELEVGNYVRPSGGPEWYKVTAISNDNEFTIDPAFQQDTQSGVTAEYNNYDGTATNTPFVHLNQFTTDTVRTPGDILKVRANQTHLYAGKDIVFDEDGTNNMIEIRGCSSTDDPWGDGSDVRPIIGFGDTAYQVYSIYDDFWKFTRLEFIEGADIYGIVNFYLSYNEIVESCLFRDASKYGLRFNACSSVSVQNCSFYSNTTANLHILDSRVRCSGCEFDGGAATTDYGLYVEASIGELMDCTFGSSSAHDVADVYFYKPSARVYARNCSFAGSISLAHKGSFLRSEDHNQTKGAHRTYYYNGTIEKDTSVVRPGGASSSAKMTPNSYCGLYPLTIADDFCAGDFKLWLPAEQKTVTIYLRTFGYTTLPTADELYIEASYLDEATGGHRATVQSTQTVSANDTWTAFSVTFTPAQEGWVYVTVYLKKYESNSGVYVDIKPVVS